MANTKSNFPTAQQPDVSSEELSMLIERLNDQRKLSRVTTPEEVEQRVSEYFDACIQNSIRPGVEGMALALGVTRQTLLNWQSEGNQKGEIITRAKQMLAALLESWSMAGKINPITGIFLMKNHFGYADKTEVEVAPRNTLGVNMTPDEIAKRIALDD